MDFSFILTALCVCVLQCLNYLTLRSCLFLSLPYTHVCFAVCVTLLFAFLCTLQPCFCFEKSDLGRNYNHLYAENSIFMSHRKVYLLNDIDEILRAICPDSLEIYVRVI